MRYFGLLWFFLLFVSQVKAETPSIASLSMAITKLNSDNNPSNDIQNVEKFLGLLPESYRSSFVIAFKSHSLQDANESFPRVIFFGADAKLMISFNGHSSQKGFHKIEMIEFDPIAKNYEFREVSFENNRAQFSEKNPSKCIGCHTPELRPNWEPYSTWPGFIGSQINNSANETKEKKLLDNYIVGFKSHPRYRWVNFTSSPTNSYSSYQSDNSVENNLMEGVSNKKLTVLLALQNFSKIVEKVKKLPLAESYQYAFLGATACVYQGQGSVVLSIEDRLRLFKKQFLPQEIQAFHDQNFTEIMKNDFGNNINLQGNFNGEFAGDPRILNYLFATQGLATQNWSLNFTPVTNAFSDRFGTPTGQWREFSFIIANSFPKLKSLNLPIQTNFDYHGLNFNSLKLLNSTQCEELAKLSREAFKEQIPSLIPPNSQTGVLPPLMLHHCIGCHTQNGFGPEIPFSQPDLMKNKLIERPELYNEIIRRTDKDAPESIRMPLFGPRLANEERGLLIHYLNQLLQ